MAIEIVDLPSYKMVIFHSYVTVYQRVIVRFELAIPRCPQDFHLSAIESRHVPSDC